MADDFLPVGIRAVAKDVGTFLSDLGKMQGAIDKISISASNVNVSLSKASAGATKAQQSISQLGNTSAQTVQGQQALGSVADQVAREMVRLSSESYRSNSALTALGQQTSASRNSLTQLKIEAASLNNEQVRLTEVHKRAAAQMQLLSSTAKQVQNSIVQQEQAVQNSLNTFRASEDQVQRMEHGLASLKGKYGENSKQVEAHEHKLAEARAELEKNRQAHANNVNALSLLRERLVNVTTANDKLRQTYVNTHLALVKNKEATLANSNAQEKLRVKLIALNAVNKATSAASGIAGGAVRGFSDITRGLAKSVGAATGALGTFVTVLRTAASAVSLVTGAVKKGIGALQGLNERLSTAAGKAFRMGNSIRFLGTSITFLVSLPAIGFLKSMTSAAVEFEEAFAGIIRTVDGADFRLLKEGSTDIRELTEAGRALQMRVRQLALEIPIPAVELAKLGEIAGTLGIRGVDNLTAFIDTTAKLGATTNVTSEEAARALGKIVGISGGLTDAELKLRGFTDAQIEGMTASERFQVSIESFGGILVALGNKTRAQEDEILKFTNEIAGAGKVVGLTTKDMFELSASFAAVGVTVSRGRTAVQKSMFGIEAATAQGTSHLEIFAKVAGKTVDEFVTLWEEDALGAFTLFSEGLGRSGDQAIAILDELQLADNRVTQALLSMAGAEGELADITQIATDELIAQATGLSALEIEAARRFSTTKSQMQLLKNQFEDLGITLGSFLLPQLNKLIAFARNLAIRFSELAPSTQKLILAVIGLAAVIGPLITFSGLLLASFGFIGVALTWLSGLFLSLASSVGLLILPIAAVIAAVAGLGIAFAASVTKLEGIADKSFGDLARNMWEWGKNIILSFARGMARAAAAIITVLNQIGKIITYWLSPGSPPNLLPDLDAWGTAAMQSYLDGWQHADFGVFNTIANKIERYIRTFNDMAEQAGRESAIEKIIGSRRAIAKVVNIFRKTGQVVSSAIDDILKSVGTASDEVKEYVESLLELELATRKVKDIQEEMAEINRKYAESLRPLNDRLKEIARRQEEVSNAMRIGELEEILADPRASELARELAELEIEEINLEGSVQSIEDQRDAELAILETRLEVAKIEEESARARFDAAQDMLDLIIKERELLNELKDAADGIGKKIKDALGDLDIPEVDTSGIESMFDGITESVDEIVKEIEGEFDGLIADLQAIFAPLETLWDELGETWAGIFDALFEPIEEWLGVKIRNPFEDFTMPSEVAEYEKTLLGMKELRMGLISGDIPPLLTDQHFAGIEEMGDALFNKLNPAVGEFLLLLADLGIIDPTSKLAQKFRELNAETEPSELSKNVAQARETIGGFAKTLQDIIKRAEPVFVFFENLGKAFGETFATIDIQPFLDAWSEFKATADDTGVSDFIRGLGELLGGVLTVALGIVIGLINGLLTAIEFMLPFFAQLLGGLGEIGSGFIDILTGIWKGLTGDEAGWQQAGEGIQSILVGISRVILSIINGLLAGIIGFVAGFGEKFSQFMANFFSRFGTEWGDFWAGVFTRAQTFWQDVLAFFREKIDMIVEYFQDLYDKLVGHSIVTDMLDKILEVFGWLGDLPEKVWGFLLGLLDKFNELKDKAIEWAKDTANSIIDGLVNGIRDGINRVKDAASEIAGGIKDRITGFLGIRSPSKELEEVGVDTIEGLIKGLEKSRKAVLDILEKLSEAMIGVSTKSMSALSIVFVKSFGTIVTLLQEFLTKFLNRFLDGMEAFVLDRENSLWGTALIMFIDFFDEIIEEWLEMTEDVVKAFLKWIDALVDLFKQQQSAMFNAGQFMMIGLKNGIESMRDAILQTAWSIANDAANIVDSAVGNASPSKVFAEIGQNIMRGWVKGLEMGEGNLLDTIGNIAERLAGAQASVQSAREQATSRQGQAAPVAVPSSYVINNNEINLGGQTFQQGFERHQLQILVEQAVRRVLE